MKVICDRCSRAFDLTLFSFGFPVRCECGRVLDETARARRVAFRETARKDMARLARQADRVCSSILSSRDLPIDIVLAAAEARDLCARLFPGQEALFERIYASRFRRLWTQFRPEEPVPDGL